MKVKHNTLSMHYLRVSDIRKLDIGAMGEEGRIHHHTDCSPEKI
jgi:hypothetical protein